MSLITLLTDFGLHDHYVGVMKGVIHGRVPGVRIVDICHEVPAGNIQAGAFLLGVSYGYFPEGTIHVIVVDPGVGTDRGVLVVEAGGQYFVGPDNGVMSRVFDGCEDCRVIRVTDDSHFLKPVSQTFHGRDIFSPLAAAIANGVEIETLGEESTNYLHLPSREPEVAEGVIQGEVIYIDHFGNAVTNISEALVHSFCKEGERGESGVLVKVRSQKIQGLSRSYAQTCGQTQNIENEPLAIVGSTGYLEIAINHGSAAGRLNLEPGVMVEVR